MSMTACQTHLHQQVVQHLEEYGSHVISENYRILKKKKTLSIQLHGFPNMHAIVRFISQWLTKYLVNLKHPFVGTDDVKNKEDKKWL